MTQKYKISTAGSVDDGKSTLIGRLLYDTNSLSTEKLNELKNYWAKEDRNIYDFSILTDGLIIEREKGITVDVAHIYINYNNERFIIADSPGHKEYTRNMISAASNSDTAIILLDVKKGMVSQTYRHLHIHNIIGTKNICIAVNKMDSVNYNESMFYEIEKNIFEYIKNVNLNFKKISVVPISALYGENIIQKSQLMNWYNGDSLIKLIKEETSSLNDFSHLFVQNQIKLNERTWIYGCFNGTSLAVNDKLNVYPQNKIITIEKILVGNKSVNVVKHNTHVALLINNDLNIDRGSILIEEGETLTLTSQFKAKICWMDNDELKIDKKMIFQFGTMKVMGIVKKIISTLDHNFDYKKANTIKMNDIAEISFSLEKNMPNISYSKHSGLGKFIMINPDTNFTSAIGFIN